jgi:hypothetical protein
VATIAMCVEFPYEIFFHKFMSMRFVGRLVYYFPYEVIPFMFTYSGVEFIIFLAMIPFMILLASWPFSIKSDIGFSIDNISGFVYRINIHAVTPVSYRVLGYYQYREGHFS